MIRIAIQNRGRLMEPSLQFLRSKGLKFDLDERKLCIPCKNADIEILLVRCSDIPTYIEQRAADFGIVGENIFYECFYEKNCKLAVVKKLNFGRCSLVIAVPKNSSIKQIEDLDGERIATSYPCLLKRYLREKNINAAVIKIQGSVEVTPQLDLADAICDISQTGKTLQEHDLKVIDVILESQAVFVTNSEIIKSSKYAEKILLEKIRTS